MKKLYCFDFDGTLTKGDTMLLFLDFYDSKKFRLQFLKHLPLFVLVKLKLAKADHVKQSLIASILKGKSKKEIDNKAQQFFHKNYPSLIRENVLEFISKIDKTKTECLLVTASLDIWSQPFADKLGMKLVATQAEFRNNVFTGEFKTPNCNGKEKVTRIKHEIGSEKFDKTIAFGDTIGDKPMMKWADEGHFRFFH